MTHRDLPRQASPRLFQPFLDGHDAPQLSPPDRITPVVDSLSLTFTTLRRRPQRLRSKRRYALNQLFDLSSQSQSFGYSPRPEKSGPRSRRLIRNYLPRPLFVAP